jgi:uncharacterized protein YqcC (DUF446 family)
MVSMGIITEKIAEIKEEMKLAGLWKKQMPAWVKDYAEKNITTGHNFAEWLQFVYLPNAMQLENMGRMGTGNHIVPQAMHYFGTDVKKGKLLQLLIELDSLL